MDHLELVNVVDRLRKLAGKREQFVTVERAVSGDIVGQTRALDQFSGEPGQRRIRVQWH